MPYFRFLAGAGGALVALMFAANAYLPPSEPTVSSSRAFDPSTIRIKSMRKGPERVVIDTSLPTIVPPAATTAVAAIAPEPKPAPRDAFAQIATEQSASQAAVGAVVKQAKAAPHKPARRHVARQYYYAPQPMPPQQRQVAGDLFSSWWVR